LRSVIYNALFCFALLPVIYDNALEPPASSNQNEKQQRDLPRKEQERVDTPAIRVQSSLVLVDIISQDSKIALPVRDLKKEDFRVFEDRHEVAIESFDSGAHLDTRPMVVWFAVICNERGKIGGSREFVGKESLFKPALAYLDKNDKVGVAHWCDNGDARLDLLPSENRDLLSACSPILSSRLPLRSEGIAIWLARKPIER
jgi:hypothetical protein